MGFTAQLLVLSPDSAIRRAASSSAASLGHDAHQVRSPDEAQRTLSRVQIDLICLDSIVPPDELEHLWHWFATAKQHATPPLVLIVPPSMSAMPAALPMFYRPNRDGLVTKPLDSAVLTREISRVLEGKRSRTNGDTLAVGRVRLDRTTRQLAFDDSVTFGLTPTELRLLSALMEQPGQYMSAEALLEQVWDIPAGTGGEEIVRAHVSNLRRKLRSHGEDPQLLHTIPYQGYAFVIAEVDHS
jgi:DNA-binding response OmpR family regulator